MCWCVAVIVCHASPAYSVVRPRGRRQPCDSRCPRSNGSRRVSGHQRGGGVRQETAPVVVLGRRLPCVSVQMTSEMITIMMVCGSGMAKIVRHVRMD